MTLNTYQKYLKVKENKHLLDKAGKNFMDSMSMGLGGLGLYVEDEDLSEYLSPKQMETIRSLYDEIF